MTSMLRQPQSAEAAVRGDKWIKVCGITEPAELDLLAARGIDLVGLWWGVPGGPHDMERDAWAALARAATAIGTLAPVLVTFAKDPEQLGATLDAAPVKWIQLHGYPTPGTVRKVKALADDLGVIKVLHVKGGQCVEESLIGSYEKAGVDVFLFDVVSDDGRVGSTGQALDPDVVAPLVEKKIEPENAGCDPEKLTPKFSTPTVRSLKLRMLPSVIGWPLAGLYVSEAWPSWTPSP